MATAPTPAPAPAGQNIAQTLGQTLSHAMPYVTSLHSWIWILIVSLFGGHIIAGLATIFFGKLAMVLVETILMLVMWIVATHPAIIAAELVTAMTVAGTDPDINIGDAAKSILTKWISLIATINAYAIGIPVVVLLLLDIKLGGGAMLMLLFMSIPLAMFTNKLNPEGTLALEIAQAALIGAMVKIAIPLMEKADAGSVGELIRNDLVNYATPIGIIVMLLVLFGFGWVKTGSSKFSAIALWLFNLRNFLKLIVGLGILYGLLYVFHPQTTVYIDSQITANQKCAEMLKSGAVTKEADCPKPTLKKEATTRAPDASNNQPAPPTDPSIAKTAQKSKGIISDPNAIEVKITKTKIGPEKYCSKNLSGGVYIFAVKDTSFSVFNKDGSGEKMPIATIIGYSGYDSPQVRQFPYPNKDYSFGFLVNDQPNTSEIKIKNGCFWGQFNTFPESREGLNMDPTKIMLSFIPKGK